MATFGESILAEESERPRKPAKKEETSDRRSEGASHSGKSGSRSNDGYKPREGGYKPREGGYKPREGSSGEGYKPREGGYKPREGGYKPREGGYKPREGSSDGYKPREGGYKPREGGQPAPRTYGDTPKPASTDSKFTDDGDRPARPASRKPDDYTRSYRGTSARATSGQRSKGPNSNRKGKPPSKEAVHKQPMLSMHKIQPFKYDMNEILNTTSLDPAKASAFLATVVAKASRISLKEAKEYINEVAEAGDITKEEQTKFNNLLQKYSKFR